MSGIERIAAERKRQIEEEGWTAEHDDQHTDKSLALAAACYAAPIPIFAGSNVSPVDAWPWHPRWDKREVHTRLRRLEIAGALCAAEIDRILRLPTEKVMSCEHNEGYCHDDSQCEGCEHEPEAVAAAAEANVEAGMKYIGELEPGEGIVNTCIYNGCLYLATTKRFFRLTNGLMVQVRFTVQAEDES